jgi:two-component system chemotaxis response regulator CheY
VASPCIVIVDDDDTIREIVVAATHEAFPNAILSEHYLSANALQEIRKGGADMLITNCHMPDIDGPTLVKTIRAMRSDIPIIMVSGSDDARALGEEAGIDRFVAKHTIYPKLPEAIHALLGVP